MTRILRIYADFKTLAANLHDMIGRDACSTSREGLFFIREYQPNPRYPGSIMKLRARRRRKEKSSFFLCDLCGFVAKTL